MLLLLLFINLSTSFLSNLSTGFTLWSMCVCVGVCARACACVCVRTCVSHSSMSDSCDPVDCSPLGSRVHGILQAGLLESVAISFWGIFPTQGSNPSLHCRQILSHLSHQGSPLYCIPTFTNKIFPFVNFLISGCGLFFFTQRCA